MTIDIDLYNKKIRGRRIPCVCNFCGNFFTKSRRDATISLRRNQTNTFCSKYCNRKYNTSIMVQCAECNSTFTKSVSQIKKSKNNFCNHSCAAKHFNKNKKHGSQRSKLEAYLEEELIKQYPNLLFHFNRRDTINAELDIFIPSLKLAFELNGIFHYEPIFGIEKLIKTKNNDDRKFQACIEHGIELCIIDTSKEKYFKLNKCIVYRDIIFNIINNRF